MTAAYQEKHDRYGPSIVGTVVSAESATTTLNERLATQAARANVEARYFDRRPILFPDFAAATDELLGEGQRLAVVADALGEHDGVEPFAIPDEESLADLETQRLADLVEPARSAALDKLGEDERAVAVAADWLRPKLALEPTPGTLVWAAAVPWQP